MHDSMMQNSNKFIKRERQRSVRCERMLCHAIVGTTEINWPTWAIGHKKKSPVIEKEGKKNEGWGSKTYCTKLSHRTTYSGTFSTASCRKNQYLCPKTGRSRLSKVILYTELPKDNSSALVGMLSRFSLKHGKIMNEHKITVREVNVHE